MDNLINNLYAMAHMLFKPSDYPRFLTLASRFPNLSLYNLLLLNFQKPDAVMVAGENAWKDNYDIDVQENAMGICLIRPAIVDEAETTIGYEDICVFDVSQLQKLPEIKQEEFSIQDFFYDATNMTVDYDREGILDGSDYEIMADGSLLVPFYEKKSEEERTKLVDKHILCAFVEQYCGLPSGSIEDKLLIQSVEYILCKRYGLNPPAISDIYVSSCKSINIVKFLISVISMSSQIIDQIENKDNVELSFADIAFIHLLTEANCLDDYEAIEGYDLMDDDTVLTACVEQFIEKMNMLSPRDYNRIYDDRKNNKMLTQPPYRVKIVEDR